MIYLTNLLARIWYNSLFEHKYTQYTMLCYAFFILQAYKSLKGHAFWSLLPSKMLFRVWSNRYIYIYIYTSIYHGKVLIRKRTYYATIMYTKFVFILVNYFVRVFFLEQVNV